MNWRHQTFQSLRQIVFFFLAGKFLVSAAPQTGGSARPALAVDNRILPVVITGLKFDDNLFLALAEHRANFAPPQIIITHLQNPKQAAATTDDFLHKILKRPPDVKYILDKAQPQASIREVIHDKENKNLITVSLEHYLNDEVPLITNRKVMIFHLTPMRSAAVDNLLEKFNEKISAYFMFTMFNSEQGGVYADSLKFLQTLQQKLVRYNDQAIFLYSDNTKSFTRNLGSTIPFEKLIPYVPLDHLKSALDHPFFDRQIFDSAAWISHSQEIKESELKSIADALFELGTRKNKEARAPRAVSKERRAEITKIMEAAVEDYKLEKTKYGARGKLSQEPSLIVTFAKKMEEMFGPAVPGGGKAEIKLNYKKRAVMEDNHGELVSYIVKSARFHASEVGIVLNEELMKFSEESHAPLLSMGKIYVASRMESAVPNSLREFNLEACHGLHAAVWFKKLFEDGRGLESNLKLIREGQMKYVDSSDFVYRKTEKEERIEALSLFRDVEADANGNRPAAKGYLLYHADPEKPHQLLIKDLKEISRIGKDEFNVQATDPFGNVKVLLTLSEQEHKFEKSVQSIEADEFQSPESSSTAEKMEDLKLSEKGVNPAESGVVFHITDIPHL